MVKTEAVAETVLEVVIGTLVPGVAAVHGNNQEKQPLV
jgi:hypothetical protein